MKRLLLVRMDKLGDLVLSLPVDQAPMVRQRETTWLISEGTGFIARHSYPPRRFFELPKAFTWSNLWRLVHWLKTEQFHAAVVLYAPWWIGLALVVAGVPVRAGRISRWHSILFFNRGVRQSRKHGDHHETDDNLALLQNGLTPTMNQSPDAAPVATVDPLQLKAAQDDVTRWGLRPRGYVVVHPGMAGSALNWPPSRYAELIKELLKSGSVVLTGTPGDRPFLQPLEALLPEAQSGLIWLNEKLNSEELLTVLAQARAVVAPSTGVLHLAAALGTPVVGLYSPVPVQRPTRWGPRGLKVKTLTSPATAAEAQKDPAAAMARITVNDVLTALREITA